MSWKAGYRAVMCLSWIVALGIVWGGVPSVAHADAYQAAVERTLRKYGTVQAVPASSIAWLARTYGRTPAAVRAGLAAGTGSASPLTEGRHAGEVVLNALGQELCWIPPGSFTMGSPASEEGRYDDEGPQHRVTLARGFWMGKHEVTQGEWEAVMGSNPSRFQGTPSDRRRPVEKVNWNEAVAFCEKLTSRERRSGKLPSGWEYRLPSESEWEYAARAGTTGARHGELGRIAWYGRNSGSGHPRGIDLRAGWRRVLENPKSNEASKAVARAALAGGVADVVASTHPVGQKQANAWGLHDMLGNVREWCADHWHGSYQGAPADGSAWTHGGNSSRRVVRGGSWGYGAGDTRAAYRDFSDTANRDYDFGFRIVMSPRTH